MQSSQSLTNDVFEILGRLAVTTASYPVEYVKVLIQLGFEPYPPRPSYTWMGRPCQTLTGCYEYMKYVRKVDGFTGLYRGLGPKLCCTVVSGTVYTGLMEVGLQRLFPWKLWRMNREPEANIHRYGDEGHCGDSEEPPEEPTTFRFFFRKLFNNSICRALAIVASHPFYVITIRKMAQFIGKEEVYGSILGSTLEIYSHDGLVGFFKGLCPRLIADLATMWLSSMAAFLVNKYVFKEKAMKGYVNASMVYLASAATYPFNLVTNLMCVNNSGLVAGDPPYTFHHSSWLQCWRHLSATGQLKRGSSIIWRYYTAPIIQLPPQHKSNRKLRNE